jgi:hypothetical protein
MSKKNVVALSGKGPDSGDLQAPSETCGSAQLAFTKAHIDLGSACGMVLDVPAADLVRLAGEAVNVAERLGVGAGLALMKAKAELPHGEFSKHLAANKISRERAAELMAVADLIARVSEEDRKKLIGQPKTALIGLARVDSEVREAMLKSGKLDQRLTLAEYQSEIQRLQEQVNRLDTYNGELKAKSQKLELIGSQVVDHVTPLPVAHVRRDAVLLAAEAGLCIDGFAILMNKLNEVPTISGGIDWARPVAVSMVSALESVRSALTEQINSVITAYGLDVSIPEGADLQMVVPGPQEKALIDSALTELLVKAQLKRAERDYAHYVEDREKNPSKGRMRKAPGVAK